MSGVVSLLSPLLSLLPSRLRPDGLTGGDVPSPLPAFTLDYWLGFVSFALFLLGNFASIVAWLVILHMFAKAVYVASRNPRYAAVARAIQLSAALYALFELALLVSFFWIPYLRIIEAWSVISAAFSVALAAAFLVANVRVWVVLRKVALHGTTDEQPSGGGPGSYYEDQSDADTIATPLYPAPRSVMGLSANGLNGDPARVPVTSLLRDDARQKLWRITLVSVVCTACSCIKAAIEALQCAVVLSPTMTVAQYWWLISLLYFVSSEIVPGVLILLALRRPPEPPAQAAQPGANLPGPLPPGSVGYATPNPRGALAIGADTASERGSERGASMYSAASAGWHGRGYDEDETQVFM